MMNVRLLAFATAYVVCNSTVGITQDAYRVNTIKEAEKQGQLVDAVRELYQGIKLEPQARAFYYVWAAELYIQLEQYNQAIKCANSARSIDPNQADAQYNRGLAYARLSRYDEAIRDSTLTLTLNPRDEMALVNRALGLRQKGAYARSLADYYTVVNINPVNYNALNGRAWIGTTCPDESFRDAENALDSARKATGEFYYSPPLAESERRKPSDNSPWDLVRRNRAAFDALAAAHAGNGECDEAIRYQKRANGQMSTPEAINGGIRRLALYKAHKPCRDINANN